MKIPYLHQNSGVYIIICLANLKFYIGSFKRLRERFLHHISDLKKGTHGNLPLQNAWNKYGEDCFIIGILEYCSPSYSLIKEQQYLDEYKPFNDTCGFNILPHARGSGSRGYKTPSEECKRRSESRKGKPASAANIAALKEAWARNRAARRQILINKTGVTFEIVSPSGELFKVTGIVKFAEEHGLSFTALAQIIRRVGNHKTVKGWHLPDVKLDPDYCVKDPNGVVYSIRRGTLQRFCKEKGLDLSRLNNVALGKRQEYHGWTKGY